MQPLSESDKMKLSQHKSAIHKVLSQMLTRRQRQKRLLKVSYSLRKPVSAT